jgi:outer membrane protein assembly factor BamB
MLRWSFKTGDSVISSPVIDSDGFIYFGSWDGHLYALRPDGQLQWKFKTGGSVDSSPSVDSDGTIYVGSSDKCVYAIG